MTIIIFIIILLALVIIHEAGHFFAAKASGVRVDEFAFGFPPKLFSVKKGETTYAFNALPIGGYVKIHGENGLDENGKEVKDKRNFSNKHPILKIFILAAGVIMNLVLAYILITISVYSSNTFIVDRESHEYKTFVEEGRIKNERAIIANIVKNSPADNAGLKPGDKIKKIYSNEENLAGQVSLKKTIDLDDSGEEITEEVSKIINKVDSKFSDSITIIYENTKGEENTTTLAGIYNLENNKDKKMIGLSFGKVATINLKFGEAIKIG